MAASTDDRDVPAGAPDAQAAGVDQDKLQEMVAQSDTGARSPTGSIGLLLACIAFAWSAFQIYFASPLPFIFTDILPGNWTLNDHEARTIHLGFAVFLGYCAYPAYLQAKPIGKRFFGWLLLLAGLVVVVFSLLTYFGLTMEAVFMGMGIQETADPAVIEEALAQAGTMVSEAGAGGGILPWIAGLLGFLALLSVNPIVSGRIPGMRGSTQWIVGIVGLALIAYYLVGISSLRDDLTGFLDIDDRGIRAHVAISAGAAALLLLAIPMFGPVTRTKITWPDWFIAFIAAFCASYLYWFYESVTAAAGRPSDLSMVVAVVGMGMLLEATRRTLGPPLMIVALVFLCYTFLGQYMPDVIATAPRSLARTMEHQWLTQEGTFGVALGVSTKMVFLFVLFGAMLEKAGAGNYFIQVAFSLLGHLRGGPAKAAVVASGMTGLISGSSIANVVTTGTFTIPLMKRVGFRADKAGAVEVASSVNGQIMPPVMGAAAFLIAEYVGIAYFDVVKHAFLPAVISYIALVYIVHLEAMKADMQGLPKPGKQLAAKWALLSFGITVASIFIVAGALYYLWLSFEWLSDNGLALIGILAVIALQVVLYFGVRSRTTPDQRLHFISTGAIVACNIVIGAYGLFLLIGLIDEVFGTAWGMLPILVLIAAAYVGLLWISSKNPPLKMEDPDAEIVALPEVGPTVRSGLYFLLPVVVLIWCLMVERLSPGLSAFWAVVLMLVILVTQRPLLAVMRNSGALGAAFGEGMRDLWEGMVTGARNMIGIGIATATAGIIVGTVSLTGIGQVMAQFVEVLSMGSLILMLLWVAVLSLILGMGLPTTANYIVVSSLMAPVVVALGAENGLVVPLIAVHMFVFYFGIMADVTPPVGLASFAAAAISGADPIRTGFTAFAYSLRTAALPFIFIFNTQLLMIGVEDTIDLILVVVSSTIAMLVFAAATQGWFLAKNKIWEAVALLLVAFTLLRPGFWMDMIQEPLEQAPASELFERAEAAPDGADIRMVAEGLTIDGDFVTITAMLPLGEAGAGGMERLSATGAQFMAMGDMVQATFVQPETPAFAAGLDSGFEILHLEVEADRPPKELFFIPAFVLLALVIWVQRRRRGEQLRTATAQA